jgi:hypothetical protein
MFTSFLQNHLKPLANTGRILRILQLSAVLSRTLLNKIISILVSLDSDLFVFFRINLLGLDQVQQNFLPFKEPHEHLSSGHVLDHQPIESTEDPNIFHIRLARHPAYLMNIEGRSDDIEVIIIKIKEDADPICGQNGEQATHHHQILL